MSQQEKKQAMVLGGGGVAGIAWITGLLLGLRENGVDLPASSSAVIGTSAGATVAAQIGNQTSLEVLFQRQVDPSLQVAELQPKLHVMELVKHAFPILLNIGNSVERTRKIGALAINATTVSEPARKEIIADRLKLQDWPERTLMIIAVDVKTGEAMVFDRKSGVDLVDAVAASCAVPGIWPPVTIGRSRFMDGGIRSSNNADMAAGFATVLVISPLGTSPISFGRSSLRRQVKELQRQGAQVFVIVPDAAARRAMGANPLSPRSRLPAAIAGRNQGCEIAVGVASFLRRAAPLKTEDLTVDVY